MSTKATKSIDFCYGHRLLDYNGKCANLHGHNGRVEIDFEVDDVGDDGFAIDFSELKNGIGKWINENLDHMMILQAYDPVVEKLFDLNEKFVLMGDRPTAENIAAWIFGIAREMHGKSITAVRLWETPTSFVEVTE